MPVYLTARDKYLAAESEPERHVFARCHRCGEAIYSEDAEWEGDKYYEVVDQASRDIVIVCEECINEYGRAAGGY